VSRLPVFSGKRVGTRVPPEMVGPLIVAVVLSIALLIAYPWIVLTAGTLAYLGCLPFGWLSYRAHEQRSNTSRAEPMSAAVAAAVPTVAASDLARPPADDDERPSRLN
jgi:CDP-diacylglycerol--serine O-phosphatidyltransferase